MGKSQRDKGYRGENNLRKTFVDAGIKCRRVPLSGGAAGCPGDLILDVAGNKKQCEVKLRADGFKQIYQWLSDNDMLFIKADRQDYLAVIRLEDLIELIHRSEVESSQGA